MTDVTDLLDATTASGGDPTGGPEAPALRVSLREYRLMVERALLATALPHGTVPAVREAVLAAQSTAPDALSLLLADLPALSQPFEPVHPTRPGAATDLLVKPGVHRPLLGIVPDLLDLAVAGALREGASTLRITDFGDPWALGALAPLARQHQVALTVQQVPDTAGARTLTVTARPAPGLRHQDDPTALHQGIPVAAAVWNALVEAADAALTPDNPQSRRHAGDSIYGPDGEVLAEAGEDEFALPEPEGARP